MTEFDIGMFTEQIQEKRNSEIAREKKNGLRSLESHESRVEKLVGSQLDSPCSRVSVLCTQRKFSDLLLLLFFFTVLKEKQKEKEIMLTNRSVS